MTWDRVGWAPPGADLFAAAPALERVRDEVAAALRCLLAADDVAWSSPAAARYRDALAEGTAGLRVAGARLDEAIGVVARHDAAVDLAREARRWEVAAQAQLGGAG